MEPISPVGDGDKKPKKTKVRIKKIVPPTQKLPPSKSVTTTSTWEKDGVQYGRGNSSLTTYD